MKNGLKKEDSMALKGLAVMMMVFHHCFYKASKFARSALRCLPLFRDMD